MPVYSVSPEGKAVVLKHIKRDSTGEVTSVLIFCAKVGKLTPLWDTSKAPPQNDGGAAALEMILFLSVRDVFVPPSDAEEFMGVKLGFIPVCPEKESEGVESEHGSGFMVFDPKDDFCTLLQGEKITITFLERVAPEAEAG